MVFDQHQEGILELVKILITRPIEETPQIVDSFIGWFSFKSDRPKETSQV